MAHWRQGDVATRHAWISTDGNTAKQLLTLPKVSFFKAKAIGYGKSRCLFIFNVILTVFFPEGISSGFEQWPSRGRNKGKPMHAIASVLKICVACTCINAKVYRHVTLPKRLLCVSDNKTTIPSGHFEQIIWDGFGNWNSFYSRPILKWGFTTVITNYKRALIKYARPKVLYSAVKLRKVNGKLLRSVTGNKEFRQTWTSTKGSGINFKNIKHEFSTCQVASLGVVRQISVVCKNALRMKTQKWT